MLGVKLCWRVLVPVNKFPLSLKLLKLVTVWAGEVVANAKAKTIPHKTGSEGRQRKT